MRNHSFSTLTVNQNIDNQNIHKKNNHICLSCVRDDMLNFSKAQN